MGLQWKMQFNPDPNRQANEIIFSCKLVSNNLLHPLVKFNNNNITRCSHQKQLRVALDSNLNFSTKRDLSEHVYLTDHLMILYHK